MGGQAIKIAERVDKETFFKYAEDIIPRVRKAFGTEVELTKSFHDKQDFGDMDLVVLVNKDFGNRRDIIKTEFSPEEIFTNGNLVSFNYNELQVDLIFTTEDNWETSQIFFAWGDLGNLMGKMINYYGGLRDKGFSLKYGFDGLKVKMHYKGGTRKFFITKDNKKVFDFLGLDFQHWVDGFNNIEEVFDYVIPCKYFDYGSFQWVNLSSINKHRNKKRPNFHYFLEYIEPYKDKIIKWDNDTDYLLALNEFFDVDIHSEYEMFVSEIDAKELAREKFNGKVVMDIYPKLRGKELGETIKAFKDQFEDFDNYLIVTDKDSIIEDFKDFVLFYSN